MGNLNIDDVRGYFMELVKPNFDEFLHDYSSEAHPSHDSLVCTYRRLVNVALTLNHQADKIKEKLGYSCVLDLISAIKVAYPNEGKCVDEIRCFANDVKHKAKLDQTSGYRGPAVNDTFPEGSSLPEWQIIKKNGDQFEACSSVVTAYVFWGKYFAGERAIPNAT